ncbi:MAG: cysteine peptidase family C39 domain-containing protein [Planctomycetota bacterium]
MNLEETIPYEAQEDAETSHRMCGAAALAMVYRSFGKEVPQSELFSRITGRSPRGAIHAKTYLLCRDALRGGFLGMVIRASDPWRFLTACMQPGVRTIVNHRIAEQSSAGHYSVVVAVDAESIVLHDPRLGPKRRIPKDEFLRLWKPYGPRCEITGNTGVVITSNPASGCSCAGCQSMLPMAASCPQCKKVFPIHPGIVLGCSISGCGERVWEALFCPFCDAEQKSLLPVQTFAQPGPASPHMKTKVSPNMPSSMEEPLSKLKELLNGKSVQSLDAVSRERLTSAVENIENLFGQTKAHLTQVAAEYQAKADELAAKAKEMQAVADQKAAEAAAARAAAAAPKVPPVPKAPPPVPPKAPPPKLSPETGQKLRKQLLQRYGKGTVDGLSNKGQQEFSEEWKDWLESGG